MRQPFSPVLVVDTNPDGVEMYSMALSLAGMPALTAASAGEALHRIETARPRALVTGLRLRGEDPKSLIRLARHSTPEGILVVGLSTAEDRATKDAAAECDLVLKVPCPPERLVAELRRALV